MNINKDIYKVFKCVLSDKDGCHIDFHQGIILSNASEKVIDDVKDQLINQNQLNRSFHKNWSVVENSDRLILLEEQIKHYLSTYGTDFEGGVYEPDENVGFPDNFKFSVLVGISRDTIKEKTFNILKSGIALEQDKIDGLLNIVEFLSLDLQEVYDNSNNKEFNARLVLKGVKASTPEECLRACVISSTGSSLIIKNQESVDLIKESDFNPESIFITMGLKKMSEIFNRFKPLFLAYKNKCPKTINKISRLSKTNHKALPVNPLNSVTREVLTEDISRSNIFTLLRSYNALHTYCGGKTSVAYKIRNGKGWCEEKNLIVNEEVIRYNKSIIKREILNRLKVEGKRFYIPEGITYALPTSEKKTFGGIPYGSSVEGNNLAVGIYWENSWGANDLDLSGVALNSKVGWNSDYNSNGLLYSGDMTNAPEGAVEYLHCKNGSHTPTLVMNNVYSGEDTCKYRIVVGKGVSLDKDHMMSKDNLIFYCDTKSQSKNTYLGLMTNNNGLGKFTLTNLSVGSARVSSDNKVSIAARKALLEDLEKQATLNEILKDYLVDYKSDEVVDLSPDKLAADTLINLFK